MIDGLPHPSDDVWGGQVAKGVSDGNDAGSRISVLES